jgi:hypothetical protein
MAFQGQITNSITMTATVAIGKFLFASQDTSESDPLQCEFSGSNAVIQGITAALTDKVLKPVAIAIEGWTFLTVNGNSTNIAKGDPLESGGSGIGVKAETDLHNVGAYALEAATTDGAIIKVRIAPLRQVGV